jgi:HEAT repeat protein
MTRAASVFVVAAIAAASAPALAARAVQQAPARPAPPATAAPGPAAPGAAAVSPAAVQAAIDKLASFDFKTRTDASRTVRRAPADVAVPALERAVRSQQADEYVRFRAAVLLADFGDVAGPVLRDMIGDKNDRVRAVAYQWFERHPSPDVLPALLAALPGERSEFVRPALTRALAAYGNDPRVRQALPPLVDRGEDLFRGAVIEALGDYRARYALADLVAVARIEGPLQDDAVTAIGKLGDPSAGPLLAELRQSGPRELQPTISAASCLLGIDCAAQQKYIQDALAFAVRGGTDDPLLRSAVHALGVLALHGHEDALDVLFDAGIGAHDPVQSAITLGIGTVALRSPLTLFHVLERRPDQDAALSLVLDAFDMLSEDFDEEQFYVAIRSQYWAAAEGSTERRTAERLIQKLEF